jgi:hypothetical protein
MMAERKPPAFTSIDTYRDALGRYSVRFPGDWFTFEFTGDKRRASTHAKRGTAWQRSKRARATRERKTLQVLEAARDASEDAPLPVREGFGFGPNPEDPQTLFTVWASPLPESVVAEDFDDLRAGVDEGLAALRDCSVEQAADDTLGNLIKFERVYTFREGEATRKRKQWLLYVDRWLMCLTWQGSSPEEYHYWLAMANQSFLGFELPEQLWFATDRDLSGLLRSAGGGGSGAAARPASAG